MWYRGVVAYDNGGWEVVEWEEVWVGVGDCMGWWCVAWRVE